MAAFKEPDEAEGAGAGETLAVGRAEPAGDRGRPEPQFAGLVWLLPARQGQHVQLRGWLRATATAELAAMAAGWAGQRHRRSPPPLAQPMVCPAWAAVLGGGTRLDADNRKTTNPLTGEPDAGDPPVRFGGRGEVKSLIPTPIWGGVGPVYHG